MLCSVAVAPDESPKYRLGLGLFAKRARLEKQTRFISRHSYNRNKHLMHWDLDLVTVDLRDLGLQLQQVFNVYTSQ